MKKRTKYYVFALFLFIAGIIGYHYLAASQAEQQIVKAIKTQSEKRDDLNLEVSSVNITPFSATVTIDNISFSFGSHLERAQILKLNFSYFDFLNIYFGGLEYGLDHLNSTEILILGAKYLDRNKLREMKIDSLKLTYRGNALDGLSNAINGTPFETDQLLEGEGANVTASLPNTPISIIKAKTLSYEGRVSKDKKNFWLNGNHQLSMDSLTWTPSKSFQNSYRFFIEGFGFPTDAIPFKYFRTQLEGASRPNTVNITTALKSNLFLLSGSGHIKLQEPFEHSQFQNTELTISEFSDSFNNVLSNIERFFSLNLPRKENSITLQVEGTIDSPSIKY